MKHRSSWCAILLAAILLSFGPGVASPQRVPTKRAVETFRVGGPNAPEEYAFASTPKLVVDRSGTIYALVPQEAAVTVLDRGGRFIRRIGRKGAGPGEFQLADAHGIFRDTLWMRNWPTPRISLFLPDGTHIRTDATPFDYGVPLSAPGSIAGLLRDGYAFVEPTGNALTGGRVKLPVLTGKRGMTSPDTVAHVLSPSTMYIPNVGTFAFDPFPAPPLVATVPDGAGLVVADWSESRPGLLTIRRFAHDGSTSSTSTMQFPHDRISSGVRDSLIAVGVSKSRQIVDQTRARGVPVPGSYEAIVERALELPTHYPPARRLVVGLDGSLWIERSTFGSTHRWTVLNPAGQAQFEVIVPANIRIQQASASEIWATTVDDVGVAYIVHMRLAN